MTGVHQDLVIGVDAGGTKTTAWIGEAGGGSTGPPVGMGHAGAANPGDVGFEGSFREISAAIREALVDAGVAILPVDVLCLCVAGAGRPNDQQRLRQWALSHRIARTVTVTGDAEPILAAASPDNVGIVLISGTGSLAWARTPDGRAGRVGGWGRVFGDDGSGYSIATAGLRAAARAADGRGEQTQLLNAMMEQLGASTPFELIEWTYTAAGSPERIAACAKVVFETAQNDLVAQMILDQASTDLAEMVTILSQKLNLQLTASVLALAGGTLMNQAGFRSDVISRIGVSPDCTVEVPCPAAGALLLARQVANQ